MKKFNGNSSFLFLTTIILLFSSCSMLEKAGIEKRKYRSGYYIPGKSFSKRDTLTQPFVKNTISPREMTAISSGTIFPVENKPAFVFTGAPAYGGQYNTGGDRKMILLKNAGNKPLHAVLSARPKQTYFSAGRCSRRVGGCGCLGELLAEIVLALLALALIALIPGLDVQTAFLIAGLVLVAVLLIAIWIYKI